MAAAQEVARDHGGSYISDEPCVEDHPGFGTAKICLPDGAHSILDDLAERGCRVCEVYADPDCHAAGHETAVYIEHEAAGSLGFVEAVANRLRSECDDQDGDAITLPKEDAQQFAGSLEGALIDILGTESADENRSVDTEIDHD